MNKVLLIPVGRIGFLTDEDYPYEDYVDLMDVETGAILLTLIPSDKEEVLKNQNGICEWLTKGKNYTFEKIKEYVNLFAQKEQKDFVLITQTS